jgi:hypothetical protein
MSHELLFILLNNKGTKQVITFQIYTYNIDQCIYSLYLNPTVLRQNMNLRNNGKRPGISTPSTSDKTEKKKSKANGKPPKSVLRKAKKSKDKGKKKGKKRK